MITAHRRYEHIWSQTKALIFLGTPHRGSDSANLAVIVGRIVNVAGAGVDTRILKTLQPRSEELETLSNEFKDVARHIMIRTYYERKETHVPGVGKTLVSETSLSIIAQSITMYGQKHYFQSDHRQNKR